jgi:two-component system, NarL family, nitrate/nitrite response regulator NarL
MTIIRLLVVDDHKLFRRGLVALLAQDGRFSVVGEAGDAGEAQRAAARLLPDLILLDNHLPGVKGIDAVAGLKEAAPMARVLMLTVSEDQDDLAAGLRAGADGYLLKTIDTLELADSVARAAEGDTVISPEMMGKLVGLLRAPPPAPLAVAAPAPIAPDDPIHSLSPREGEILRLLAHGSSNKLIARELDIAETTVKIHVQNLLRKLGLSNRVHAAVYATERGWT